MRYKRIPTIALVDFTTQKTTQTKPNSLIFNKLFPQKRFRWFCFMNWSCWACFGGPAKMQQFSLEIQLIHRKPPAKKVKCILKRGIPKLHIHFLGFPRDPLPHVFLGTQCMGIMLKFLSFTSPPPPPFCSVMLSQFLWTAVCDSWFDYLRTPLSPY